ncbi:hypothetical protein PaeCFBP13512_18465 [Paenibacillus sp. CFBP13512]|uniref:hypothetical protein n=1 Tax=Paenibacillus sp. CFBP13512 TaxID=2184007 RepID=UPI0010BF68CB|nr:hypothetical protein [Paenibacillus sp. CFBP13512]TKJ87207.1 hypothetical protein PaeCFBP13512_18465 [Paenibacillus sp. CFBP13512]
MKKYLTALLAFALLLGTGGESVFAYGTSTSVKDNGFTDIIQGMGKPGRISVVSRGEVRIRLYESCSNTSFPAVLEFLSRASAEPKVVSYQMKNGCLYKGEIQGDSNIATTLYLTSTPN